MDTSELLFLGNFDVDFVLQIGKKSQKITYFAQDHTHIYD